MQEPTLFGDKLDEEVSLGDLETHKLDEDLLISINILQIKEDLFDVFVSNT